MNPACSILAGIEESGIEVFTWHTRVCWVNIKGLS